MANYLRLFIFFCLAVLSACSDDVDIYKPNPLVDVRNEFSIKTVWSRRIGSETLDKTTRLAPQYLDKKIYTADNQGKVSVLNADNGKIIWQKKLDIAVGGGPAVSPQQVVVAGQQGEVIALSSEDGELLWQQQIGREIIAPPAIGEGNVVVVSVDGRITALDASTGETRWFYDKNIPSLTLRGTSSPVIAGGGVFCGFADGKLAVHILENGAQAWEKTITVPSGRTEIQKLVDVDVQPLLLGNSLYVASFNGNLMSIDVSNGQVNWQRELSTFQEMTVSELLLLVTHENSHVSAIDRTNGVILWTQKDLYQRSLSPPIALGDAIMVADFEGYLHWLNRKDGSMLSRHHLDSAGIYARPLLIDQKIILQSNSGKVYAIQKK